MIRGISMVKWNRKADRASGAASHRGLRIFQKQRVLCALALSGIFACGGDGSSTADPKDAGQDEPFERVEMTVGKSGGELALENGAGVEVPEGALEGDTKVAVEEVSHDKLPDAPGNAMVAGPSVAFTPHGQEFKMPVRISLPYDSEKKGERAVHRLDDEKDTTWEEVKGAKFEEGKASFDSKTFSVLRVVVSTGGSDDTEDSGAPTPANDAGTRDAGTIMDSGTKPDAGTTPDAGTLDSGMTDSGIKKGPPVGARLYVLNNGQANAGTIDQRKSADLTLAESGTFTTGERQGAVYDYGELVQVGDTGNVRTICGIEERVDNSVGEYDAQRDRMISGENITAGKGMITLGWEGWYVVADHGAAKIKVFSRAVAGPAQPMFELGLPASTSVWDVAYSSRGDRLYAALTNGSVAVYDGFTLSSSTNRTAPDRTFWSSAPHSTHSNFHGILYHYDTDMLIVSDVGATQAVENANFASDGSLVMFQAPGELSGPVVPTKVIAGAATKLGNPVDIHMITDYSNGGYANRVSTLYVAEKAANLVLAWVDIFNLSGGNVAPTLMAASDQPEALTGEEFLGASAGADGPNTVLTLQNPGVDGEGILPGNYRAQFVNGLDQDGELSLTLSQAFDTYEGADPVGQEPATMLLESVAMAGQYGDAFITFSATSAASNPGGGIQVVHTMPARRGGEFDTVKRDRIIQGSNTGLMDPKGIVHAWNYIAVADYGAADVKFFNPCVAGNVAPFATLSDLGAETSVWDLYVEYNQVLESDTLYVAATNGTILAYDDIETTWGEGGPTRTIRYEGGINAHAIDSGGYWDGDAYVEALFVADVGDPANATDGAIYRIHDYEIADGEVTPAWRNAGSSSLLGDPVDLLFDSSAGLLVAEKGQNKLLQFSNPFLSAGMTDLSPSRSVTVTSPQSIATIWTSQQ